MQRFRDGLVLKALRLLYHSTLAVRVIKKKKSGLTVTSNAIARTWFDIDVGRFYMDVGLEGF